MYPKYFDQFGMLPEISSQPRSYVCLPHKYEDCTPQELETAYAKVGLKPPSQRPTKRVKRPKLTLQEKFEAFHAEHPEIYDLFVQFSREIKGAGFKRYGIQSIAERVRWHVDTGFEWEKGEFKLNNNHCSRYARLIMQREPDLKGFFQLRRLLVQ
jgi:hypothetical protein